MRLPDAHPAVWSSLRKEKAEESTPRICDPGAGKMEVTDDTYAIHHFNGGWLDEEMRLVNKQTQMRFDSFCQRAGQ